jgi:outer membrane protein
MKNLQLIVNIVLLVAVGVLFILLYSGKNSGNTSKNESGAVVTQEGQIYYVEIDSVIANYDMATDLAAELEKSFQTSDTEFANRQAAYQREVTNYQDRYNRGLITRSEATTIEEQLYTKQQELLNLQQTLSDELAEKQSVMNRQLIDAIMQYLDNSSDQFNYKYVLGATFGGNVLYAMTASISLIR